MKIQSKTTLKTDKDGEMAQSPGLLHNQQDHLRSLLSVQKLGVGTMCACGSLAAMHNLGVETMHACGSLAPMQKLSVETMHACTPSTGTWR